MCMRMIWTPDKCLSHDNTWGTGCRHLLVQKAETLLNTPQCTRQCCHNNKTLGHNCQFGGWKFWDVYVICCLLPVDKVKANYEGCKAPTCFALWEVPCQLPLASFIRSNLHPRPHRCITELGDALSAWAECGGTNPPIPTSGGWGRRITSLSTAWVT